jgi:CDGSH iron-sulfur domain-containing protein 3
MRDGLTPDRAPRAKCHPRQETAQLVEQDMAQVELIVRRNGSTLVVGDVVLKDQDGNVIVPPKAPFALCRCGASKNKPFCDGSHKAINFDDGSMARTT